MNILFLLCACSEKSLDTSTVEVSQEAPMSNGDCAYLEEGECLSSQGCTPLMASPITYDEQESCWTREDMVFAECMSVEMGCGHGIIHARGPDTECMMFPNMCIPINWHICTQEFPECME